MLEFCCTKYTQSDKRYAKVRRFIVSNFTANAPMKVCVILLISIHMETWQLGFVKILPTYSEHIYHLILRQLA